MIINIINIITVFPEKKQSLPKNSLQSLHTLLKQGKKVFSLTTTNRFFLIFYQTLMLMLIKRFKYQKDVL